MQAFIAIRNRHWQRAGRYQKNFSTALPKLAHTHLHHGSVGGEGLDLDVAQHLAVQRVAHGRPQCVQVKLLHAMPDLQAGGTAQSWVREAVVLPALTGTGGAQAGTSRRKMGDLGPTTGRLYCLSKPHWHSPGWYHKKLPNSAGSIATVSELASRHRWTHLLVGPER
jgi:hypothetical protein